MTNQVRLIRVLVRIPRDVQDFLDCEAEKNCSSRNSEIIRAIRAKMESEQARKVQEGMSV
jgi:hypothetical protein